MKLEQDVFPNFYKYRECVVEEPNAELFTGRKQPLEFFWNRLYEQANRQHPWNIAITSQRKSGKSAFLSRCFNLAFWEQDEVIPFYYSLQEEQYRHIRELCYTILFAFAKQAVAFALKDPAIMNIKTPEEIKKFLQKRREPWAKTVLSYWEKGYPEMIEKALGPDHLNHVWLFIDAMSHVFKKRCVFIFDEAQELARCVLHEKAEPLFPDPSRVPAAELQPYIISCHESVKFIHNNPRIWILVSGSCVSMLMYRVIAHGLENRFQKEPMNPLAKEEALELVEKIVHGRKIKAYAGLAEKVYELVGGNPFYITTLFEQKLWQKAKYFDSPAGVETAYQMEVLHPDGKIFRFWNEHLLNNAELLNHESVEERKKTFRVLQYIAGLQGQTIYYVELEEKFPDIENLMAKLVKLREADFLLTDVDIYRRSGRIEGLRDRVLAVFLLHVFYEELLDNPSLEKQQQAVKMLRAGMDIMQIQAELGKVRRHVKKITHRVENLDDRQTDAGKQITQVRDEVKETRHESRRRAKKVAAEVKNLAETVAKVDRGVKSLRGTEAQVKGTRKENEVCRRVRVALEKGQGFFQRYTLVGSLTSRNFKLDNGKGYELDIVGRIREEKSGREMMLAIEVKDRKTKVTAADAEKFVRAVKTVKQQEKLPVVALYLDTQGRFAKSAAGLLEKCCIRYGKVEEFVQ
jgi:hypothetical protein